MKNMASILQADAKRQGEKEDLDMSLSPNKKAKSSPRKSKIKQQKKKI